MLRSVLMAGAIGLLSSGGAQAAAIISYGQTALGVNNEGHLNVAGVGPAGFTGYGVYRLGVGDATYPGCLCEGWGIRFDQGGITRSGSASIDNGGIQNIGGGTFGATSTTATSMVGIGSTGINVTHAFGPSLANSVFQVNVTVTNTTDSAIDNLVYRRVMDWDVPPTEFNEYVTHKGVSANLVSNGGNVLYASDNGFANANPINFAGSILPGTVNTDFTDSGPADHGSIFDFAFGSLAAGASRIFNIFYGSAGSEGEALSQAAALNLDVYSLGQSNGGQISGSPATFIFGFGGVGGVEPGTTPDNPILPFVPAPGQYTFTSPPPRRWYDPPFATGFRYELTGGTFITVGAPDASYGGSGPYDIFVGGMDVGDLLPGGTFDLTPFMTSIFELRGLRPVDTADPTAFPTFLDFTDGSELRMIAIGIVDGPTPTPAPASLALFGLGAAGLLAGRRRRA